MLVSSGLSGSLCVSKGAGVSPWPAGCHVSTTHWQCVSSRGFYPAQCLGRHRSNFAWSGVPENVAVRVADDDASTDSSWEAFAASASGEWEGVTATFDQRGQPLELPEHFVPSAYREWDVHLYDWQTQCSSQAVRGDGLKLRLKRLMPTVGCEADAVAFTEEAQHGLQSHGELPITPGGSYLLAPAGIEAGAKRLRLEACLTRPSLGPLAPRERTRIVCNLKRQQGDGLWELDDVQVHNEKWVSPYNGGAELAGCGGGQGTFAKRPALERSSLQAAWSSASRAPALVQLKRESGNSTLQRSAAPASASRFADLLESALLLPAGIAVSVVLGKDSVELASALVSDGNKGTLLGAAMVHFSMNGLEEVAIY